MKKLITILITAGLLGGTVGANADVADNSCSAVVNIITSYYTSQNEILNFNYCYKSANSNIVCTQAQVDSKPANGSKFTVTSIPCGQAGAILYGWEGGMLSKQGISSSSYNVYSSLFTPQTGAPQQLTLDTNGFEPGNRSFPSSN